MTSVFNEKSKGKPSINEEKAILKMRKEGKSIDKIVKETGYTKAAILEIFPDVGKGGSTKAEDRVSKDTVKDAYIKVIQAKKNELQEKLGANPSAKAIAKEIGITKLHDAVKIYLKTQGIDLSDSSIRRKYATFSKDFETEVMGKTSSLPHEKKKMALDDQSEYTKAVKDKKWMLKTGERQQKKITSAIDYLNDVIAKKYGEWTISHENVEDNAKLAKLFHDDDTKKHPVCVTPKYIPIKDWTPDDVLWALYYIDWVGETAQIGFRNAINRLKAANPTLQIEHMDAGHRDNSPGGNWSQSTYQTKFGIAPKRESQKQAAKTGELKKAPSIEQVKSMFKVIATMPFEGRAFKKLKDKHGKTVELGIKEAGDLEREALLVAIQIAALTGARAGHTRDTEIGSLKFSDILTSENKIECKTKTSKGKRRQFDVNPYIIEVINKYKASLQSKGINTDKMYIIPMEMQSINRYLRTVAEEAGVCTYKRIYGQRLLVPGSRGKYKTEEFQPGDKRINNPDYLIETMNFQGQKVTIDAKDPDPHLHLFRAFHLWELVKAKVPFEYAISVGIGWDDPKTALDYYLKGLMAEEKAKYAKKEEDIFKQLK